MEPAGPAGDMAPGSTRRNGDAKSSLRGSEECRSGQLPPPAGPDQERWSWPGARAARCQRANERGGDPGEPGGWQGLHRVNFHLLKKANQRQLDKVLLSRLGHGVPSQERRVRAPLWRHGSRRLTPSPWRRRQVVLMLGPAVRRWLASPCQSPGAGPPARSHCRHRIGGRARGCPESRTSRPPSSART